MAAYKEKDKQKYLKGKATGVIKTNKISGREKRKCRKSWRVRSTKYYKKVSEDFIRANTPSSMCEELLRNLHLQLI